MESSTQQLNYAAGKLKSQRELHIQKLKKGLLYIEINKTKGEEQTVKIEN